MITVRFISDTKNSDAPFAGEMLKLILGALEAITLRVIGYLLRHPKHVPRFIRMVRQASNTAKRLAEVGQQEIIPRIERVITQKIA